VKVLILFSIKNISSSSSSGASYTSSTLTEDLHLAGDGGGLLLPFNIFLILKFIYISFLIL